MGFMTVVTVLNDAAHDIKEDGSFGRSVYEAIIRFSHRQPHFERTIPARSSERSVFCNAAEVIAQAHADHAQFVVAWHNTGWEITEDPDDGVPENLIRELEMVLRRRRKTARTQQSGDRTNESPDATSA